MLHDLRRPNPDAAPSASELLKSPDPRALTPKTRDHKSPYWSYAINALTAVVLAAVIVTSRTPPAVVTAALAAGSPPGEVTQAGATPPAPAPLLTTATICKNCAPFTHAASLAKTSDGMAAFWYQGIREGAYDVSIQSSRFDGKSWSAPVTVVDQLGAAQELGRFVKSLGNPVAHVWPDGTISLFFVSISMRGWATAYIAAKQSRDGGKTWSQAKRLVTSPIWNLSTMVKTTPLALSDDRILLPAYWSLGTSYPVMIEITKTMDVIDIKRMAPRGVGLQPAIAKTGGDGYVGVLRTLSRDIKRYGLRSISSSDDGNTWGAPVLTGLGNPGSPVTIIPAGAGKLGMIFNEKSEDNLAIIFSKDGGNTWSNRAALPADSNKSMIGKAYPYAIASADGVFDLVYSCGGFSSICHTRFNQAWADAQQVPAGAASR